MRRNAIIMGAIFAGTAAAAEPVALTNQAIKDTVTGSVMHLDTPVGTKLPVRYADDGLISGEAGDLASYLGAASDRGRWWVEKNRLCHKWFKWFDAEVQCLQLRQDGQRIFWRSVRGLFLTQFGRRDRVIDIDSWDGGRVKIEIGHGKRL